MRDSDAGGQPRLERAFTAAFGRSPPAPVDVGRKRLVYSPHLLVQLGHEWALVSRGDNSDDCLACSGAVSIHYLRERADRFEALRGWLEAVPGSAMGRASDRLTATHVLSSFPVLASEASSIGQGYICGGLHLLELRPEGPRSWGYVPTLYDDTGVGREGRGRRVTGRIANIVRSRSFDVVYSGDVTARQRYVIRSGKAVPLGGSRQPRC